MSLTCPVFVRETVPALFSLAVALAVVALVVNPVTAADATLKKGDRIVFLGDSITQAGERPDGYIQVVREFLKKRHAELELEVIGAGISGHKVPDLEKRLDRDVLAHKPQVVVIYIGINDVWHSQNGKGTSKEDFEAGLGRLIERIETSGARVVLCTPSVIGEKPAVLDALSQLKRAGWTIGVLSNAMPDEVHFWSECPVSPLIEEAVFSYQVGCMKPEPEIYKLACNRLGAQVAETVFVGDGGFNELQGAAAVGMRAVQAEWFTRREIEWTAEQELIKVSEIGQLSAKLESYL